MNSLRVHIHVWYVWVWKFTLETLLPINTLPNVSYSGYRNHVQNYTLQRVGEFGPCDGPDNMLIYGLGGETEQHPALRQYLIGQHTILGCVKKPSLKTQDTIKLVLFLSLF